MHNTVSDQDVHCLLLIGSLGKDVIMRRKKRYLLAVILIKGLGLGLNKTLQQYLVAVQVSTHSGIITCSVNISADGSSNINSKILYQCAATGLILIL